MDGERLSLTQAEMRELGYRVIDLIVDHVPSLPDKPVTRRASRANMQERFREACPWPGARRSTLDHLASLAAHVRETA